MNRICNVLLLVIFGCITASAQTANYWQQTPQTPTQLDGQGNMSICIGSNDALFIGTMRSGIFKSTDQGQNWENVLPLSDTSIEQIVTTPAGDVYAIGASMLFYSHNNGNDWKRRPVPTDYYLTDIVVTNDGKIIVSTGAGVEFPDETFEYMGDGIFSSKDNGETWIPCNNGIGVNKAVSHLARSSDGTLVMTMPAIQLGRSGIYLSKDDGLSWKKLNNPRYKDRVNDDVLIPRDIYEVYCLDFDRDDNLYLSYEGASGSVGMSGGLTIPGKHLLTDSLWKPVWLNELGFEWQYHPFFSVYRSQHNHLFASLNRFHSLALGGAHVSSHDAPFRRIIDGIEPVLDSYLKVVYAEDSHNRIYAVQIFDHRVYYSDSATAQPTSVRNIKSQPNVVTVHPVPASDFITVECKDQNNTIQSLTLYNQLGLSVFQRNIHTQQYHIPVSDLPPGIYFLTVQTQRGAQNIKVVVKE